ncbi:MULTISPECIES: acyl carrier protein [Holospora]|uniref:Acyl carrier protein n=2 Tax=Holospora TaxID=44747 RepID=A0A061JGV1_9PROT|nr:MULTISPECIES: acyl carrier protein [Holospora]ETZ05320.1 acyl carrier protein [Holospora undulata HU1]GAJ46854.1 acyl carrier protein [Holospora elegans E1]
MTIDHSNSSVSVETKRKSVDEVFREISEILAQSVAHNKEITMDSSITGDFGADSLDQIELVMDLEKRFGCTISDEETSKIKTVGDIVGLVMRLSNEEKA